MKKTYLYLFSGMAILFLFAGIKHKNEYGFEKGTPEIKSISSLAFGPDGILFIGDSKSATVFAVNTKDSKATTKGKAVEVKNIDQKIAAALGTDVKNITITDLAVNPVSKKVYVAVQNSDGTPVLLKLEGDKIESFSFKNVEYSGTALNNAPAEDAKDRRGRPLRVSAISDLGYAEGKVMVSGLSNKEFSSAFTSIPFPFTDRQDVATLEIYHASHGRYETAAPVKTFTTAEINGKKYLVASYTCTPLVLFPLNELKPGTHVKGRTVAEMGNGNTPLDMITIKKGKESFLVMGNTSRPAAEVNYKNLASFEGTLTERVPGTGGVSFTALPLTNVLQLDKLDNEQVIMLQKKQNGDIDLWTANGSNL